jgi:hypothetical protein
MTQPYLTHRFFINKTKELSVIPMEKKIVPLTVFNTLLPGL